MYANNEHTGLSPESVDFTARNRVLDKPGEHSKNSKHPHIHSEVSELDDAFFGQTRIEDYFNLPTHVQKDSHAHTVTGFGTALGTLNGENSNPNGRTSSRSPIEAELAAESADYAWSDLAKSKYTLFAEDGQNILQPELLESLYYLRYFADQDSPEERLYQTWGAKIFNAFKEHSSTKHGYSSIDVDTGAKKNSQESFFMAETLKYSYLLFASREALDLDRFVFTTEAHPLPRRIPGNEMFFPLEDGHYANFERSSGFGNGESENLGAGEGEENLNVAGLARAQMAGRAQIAAVNADGSVGEEDAGGSAVRNADDARIGDEAQEREENAEWPRGSARRRSRNL